MRTILNIIFDTFYDKSIFCHFVATIEQYDL